MGDNGLALSSGKFMLHQGLKNRHDHVIHKRGDFIFVKTFLGHGFDRIIGWLTRLRPASQRSRLTIP